MTPFNISAICRQASHWGTAIFLGLPNSACLGSRTN